VPNDDDDGDDDKNNSRLYADSEMKLRTAPVACDSRIHAHHY